LAWVMTRKSGQRDKWGIFSKIRPLLILLCLFLQVVPALSASLYFYTDDQGGLFITNIPPISRWNEGTLIRVKRVDLPDILEASRLYGIDPLLLQAIVYVESGGDAHAVSKKGAIGLAQLMPATAKAVGVKDPFDPRDNIFGAARYLKQLIERFHGDLILALSAYNVGPGTVERYGTIPDYPETRLYVRKVLETWKELSLIKRR